jgi:hypothetical protein
MAFSLLLAFFAVSALAASSSGPLKSGLGRTPEAEQVVADAGRQSNGTSSNDFTRTFNNTPETWNWRINTTELAVPSPIDDLGKPEANYSQGLKVANIQWQLQWPGSDEDGSSFQSFLKARNATASFEAVIVNLPDNITDGYKDEDNGSCKTILGEQCVQSLADDSSSREGCEHTLSVDIGGIRSGGDFSKCIVILCCLMCLTKLGVDADTNTHRPTEP